MCVLHITSAWCVDWWYCVSGTRQAAAGEAELLSSHRRPSSAPRRSALPCVVQRTFHQWSASPLPPFPRVPLSSAPLLRPSSVRVWLGQWTVTVSCAGDAARCTHSLPPSLSPLSLFLPLPLPPSLRSHPVSVRRGVSYLPNLPGFIVLSMEGTSSTTERHTDTIWSPGIGHALNSSSQVCWFRDLAPMNAAYL